MFSTKSSLRSIVLAGSAVSVIALAGCAGSAGGSTTGSGGNADASFTFGAPQSEVDSVVEDLEPVTLVYQGLSSSPNSPHADESVAFKEAVESRSNGKIEIEIIWGQGVAGYTEIFDALDDGRLDISYSLPVYDPSKFPAFSDLLSTTGALQMSPLVGEMTASAAIMEAAWNAEAVLSEFEEQGLTPLGSPINAVSAPYFTCNEPGTTAADWGGRQIRVGSTAFEAVVKNMGATPVSLEYAETYEALQRKSIDCTLIQTSGGVEAGYFDVANNISYPEGSSLPVSAGVYLTGSSFDDLPLAYQQIVFDSSVAIFGGNLGASTASNAIAAEAVKENDGSIAALDEETSELIGQTSNELVQQAIDGGRVASDIGDQLVTSQEKWSQVAAELGYEDGGSLEAMDEWHDPNEFDPEPFMQRVFEEVLSAHRPQ